MPLGPFRQTVAPDAPVAGAGLALVVISHGTGGGMDNHHDTARALAEAGFVVAALEHPGDTWRDRSRAADVAARPAALKRLVDFMLGEWQDRAALDPARVGAFGFSSGGFTVLAAAGGEPDLSLVVPHCRSNPDLFDCRLAASASRAPDVPPARVAHDPRIAALVVVAPALGFTFAGGLGTLRQPVQLWRADADQVLPAPFYADAVRAALPVPPEFRTVAEAGHFDFLAPCSDALRQAAPAICQSAAGFDRPAFHAQFNAAVVDFLRSSLSPSLR